MVGEKQNKKRNCIKGYQENFICVFIWEKNSQSDNKGGRPSHGANKQLMISLWMFANQESYRSVADRFDVSISTAWEYFHKRLKLLQMVFKKEQEAIGGTHIPITQPHLMPNSYINRNKYHSIVLQGVCSANYMFIDCFAGK
ncbi:hypothetical protein MML48_9g00011693 [Holotrichia oblita]|uniref:Uncharacterized protein n=1 Tax=Holotrichia oblita TaxID=644536 RepID=A0ACB9SKM4_HOLOL|nr:hypothetical protein MML48_9g00011693 [Holotrichia oblita]